MTIICAFDTETNGLLTKNNLTNLQTVFLLQLTWIIYDTDTQQIEENDYILKCPVPITNSHIHGITDSMSQDGYNFSDICDIFMVDLKRCDCLVFHNGQFDLNILELELYRLEMFNEIDILFSKNYYDTMKQSVNLLKIKGKYGYKFPKLIELYKYYFKREFEGQHDALYDTRATLECYLEMVKSV